MELKNKKNLHTALRYDGKDRELKGFVGASTFFSVSPKLSEVSSDPIAATKTGKKAKFN